MKCDVDFMGDSSSQWINQKSANPLLSIVIPTYNRADFLDYCLAVHIPLARAHNIQFFIFDNASTDTTEEVVNKRSKEYPLIKYHRNDVNVGPDKNFEQALKYPQTEYVWLLGDTYQIASEGIDYLVELITANNNEYDAIIFNFSGRVFDIPQQDYSDQNKLLSDLGWHMTCMASMVYSSKLIANAHFKRYRNTNFIQTGVIFEHIANKKFLVHWAETLSIQTISIKGIAKQSWQNQIFEIWTERWPNFIFSLPPSYKLNVKLKCVKDHGIKTDIFTLKLLLVYRSRNFINYEIYTRYSHFFPLTTRCPKFIILLIAIIPQSIPQFLKTIKKIANGSNLK